MAIEQLTTATEQGDAPAERAAAPSQNRFEQAAGDRRASLLSELTYFLATNKKWWLLPILVVIALLGALAALGGTGLAPWIYTMF